MKCMEVGKEQITNINIPKTRKVNISKTPKALEK